MYTLHEIPVDGEVQLRQIDEPPTSKQLRAYFGSSSIEYVSVLYKGVGTTMIVDEVGAIQFGNRLPLPPNPRATEIYHAARARNETPDDTWPRIHGPALLVEGWWHKADQ